MEKLKMHDCLTMTGRSPGSTPVGTRDHAPLVARCIRTPGRDLRRVQRRRGNGKASRQNAGVETSLPYGDDELAVADGERAG